MTNLMFSSNDEIDQIFSSRYVAFTELLTKNDKYNSIGAAYVVNYDSRAVDIWNECSARIQ